MQSYISKPSQSTAHLSDSCFVCLNKQKRSSICWLHWYLTTTLCTIFPHTETLSAHDSLTSRVSLRLHHVVTQGYFPHQRTPILHHVSFITPAGGRCRPWCQDLTNHSPRGPCLISIKCSMETRNVTTGWWEKVISLIQRCLPRRGFACINSLPLS